jgi:hypothetical protein
MSTQEPERSDVMSFSPKEPSSPPSVAQREEPPTALLIEFDPLVEASTESVRAATTPSLLPYEPFASITPSAPPTSPEPAQKDMLLAPIIAVAEHLSKLVLTDDDSDKEKGEKPNEETKAT